MPQFNRHINSFTDAYKAVRVIETLENYAVADQMDFLAVGDGVKPVLLFNNASNFWDTILKNPANTLDILVDLKDFIVSEWVPRVPGLYWHKDSWLIRQYDRDGRAIYMPPQKSIFVTSGIGTNLFAPDLNEHRIISLCNGGYEDQSASGGIPALITNKIWDKLGLQPGVKLALKKVKWQRMTQEWSQRFESVTGIPRAYLYIENESQVVVTLGKVDQPMYQPFSLIEYVKDDVLLYDFIYFTVDKYTSHQEVADFFEMYRTTYGYNGRYLLNPDPANPLFDAAYDSPEQLRRAESGGQYHLEMLKERIRGTYFKGKLAEYILQVLSRSYADADNIKRIATYLKFPVVQFASIRPADRIAQLVDWCIDNPGKMEELIDKMTIENPDLLYH